jgi:hypothetical protein
MTRICCVCNKIESHGAWIAAESGPGPLSHGYCPVCYDNELENIRLFLHERDMGKSSSAHIVSTRDCVGACAL